jgi:uncharacterized membrane protein
MDQGRRFAWAAVAVGLVALGHAALTWPPRATVALFGGGAALAFLAEAVVINGGWLDHHVGPALLGVPLYVLFGWTATSYVAARVALLVTSGWAMVALAAALATGYDLLTDHQGVAAGYWTYADDLRGPRYRGVPWWNYAGWFVVSGLTVAVTVPFL